MKVRRSIVIVMLLLIMVLLIGSVFAQEKKIVYTTLDLRQEYEIITIIAGYALVSSTLVNDPFAVAFKNAWKDFQKTAEVYGADAVIGVRMDLENLTKDNAGRLIIYGTAVKLKAK